MEQTIYFSEFNRTLFAGISHSAQIRDKYNLSPQVTKCTLVLEDGMLVTSSYFFKLCYWLFESSCDIVIVNGCRITMDEFHRAKNRYQNEVLTKRGKK